MKYLLIFVKLTLKNIFTSVFYYLSVAVMIGVFAMLVAKFGPLLNNKTTADLVSGQLVYILLPMSILLVFMCIPPVFMMEKQLNTIQPLLYSPTNVNEILFGKCLGLVIAALIGSAVSFIWPVALFPVILKSLLSLKALAALVIIFGIVFSYAIMAGMLMFCFSNIKMLYPVLFFLNYIPMGAQKYTKAYMEANGFCGVNWAYFVSLCILIVFSAGVYKFYFSKYRIVASV